jgi:hypothetical protein
MSNLRIKRSTTSNRNNSAKTNGRSTSIQGNNVHIDKGKSVAYPIEQPAFSYKEMLRKEPPKVSLENDEDDTICERCSHILAKCFSKTKKEDSINPQEVEIGRPKPRSIPHLHSIQSRLSPQYEQPKMARSWPTSYQTLDSRFESIRKPRMIRPSVSEAGRWVTLETLDLNQYTDRSINMVITHISQE